MTGPGPTIWRYVLRNVKHEGWAIVLMDSSGYFSVVSDFGNYAFKWTHFGTRDFREFLIGLEPDYLLSKISQRDTFDGEGTVRRIKDEILELRRTRSRTLTRETAREEWDRVESIDDKHAFDDWLRDTSLDEAWEYGRMDYPGDARGFAKRVWPRLCELWRADLANVMVPPQV